MPKLLTIILQKLNEYNVELKRGTPKPCKCKILIPSPFSDLLSGASKVIDYEQEDKERAEWALGDYDNGEDGCPHCKRMRLCKCDNGMHRCEKCNWCPELNGYAPYSD